MKMVRGRRRRRRRRRRKENTLTCIRPFSWG